MNRDQRDVAGLRAAHGRPLKVWAYARSRPQAVMLGRPYRRGIVAATSDGLMLYARSLGGDELQSWSWSGVQAVRVGFSPTRGPFLDVIMSDETLRFDFMNRAALAGLVEKIEAMTGAEI